MLGSDELAIEMTLEKDALYFGSRICDSNVLIRCINYAHDRAVHLPFRSRLDYFRL